MGARISVIMRVHARMWNTVPGVLQELREFHARGWYMHELITSRNVGMVAMGRSGNAPGWSLLEFGNTSRQSARGRADAPKFVLRPRLTPPEVRTYIEILFFGMLYQCLSLHQACVQPASQAAPRYYWSPFPQHMHDLSQRICAGRVDLLSSGVR